MKLLNTLTKTMIVGMLVASTSVSAFAANTDKKDTLTLEQAVNRAITSCDKKAVYGSYLEAYEELNKYNKDVFSTTYRNQKLNEMTYKFNMKYINDKIAYDTTDTYLTVLNINKQMDLVNNQISIAEKKVNQMKIKLDKGMASELDYNAAENDLKNLKAQKLGLEKKLENEKMDFKNLTNMDITKYELDTDFKLEPVNITGAASYYFDKKLEEYYELSQEKIYISKLGNVDLIGSEVGQYKLQEANITSQEYNLDMLKENMSTKLLGFYNNLSSIEAAVGTYDIKIAAAKDSLKAQEIRFNNGYISKLDYEQALVQEKSLECDKFAQIQTYITTKMMVEQPNILAMSAEK